MKAIFLDKDGVLNSDEYLDNVESKQIDGIKNDIDVNTIKLLKKVIDETGANVILSSSCIRNRQYTELLKKLFLNYSIILGEIPFMPKALGIKKWLDEHPNTEDYVILEDEVSKTFNKNRYTKWKRIWRRITSKRYPRNNFKAW